MNKFLKLLTIVPLTVTINAKSPIKNNKIKENNIPINMSDDVFEDSEKSKNSYGLISEVRNITLKLKHKLKNEERNQITESGAEIISVYGNYVMIKLNTKDIKYIKTLDFISYIYYPSHLINNTVYNKDIYLNLLNKTKYTGKNVKIAIIDRGFKLINNNIKKQVKSWKSFSEKRSYDGGPSLEGDSLSHGTAVIEVINKIAPNAELYPIVTNSKISFGLITAIDTATEYKPDIICMSVN